MRNFPVIWRRELAACFLSPVAYVTMVCFLAVSGWVYLQLIEGHAGTEATLVELLLKVLVFFWLPLLTSVITMRLFAEERRSGGLEALLTAPVSDLEVVLGKYAGALAFLLLVTAPALSWPYVLARMSPGLGPVAGGPMAAGCLLFLFMAAFCVAVGLVVSLLTRNQIVAALCCFCCLLIPLLAVRLLPLAPFVPSSVRALLLPELHLADFAAGVVDTRPLVLYGSLTALLLFVAVRVLESRLWR